MQMFHNFWRTRLNVARNRILMFVIIIGILPLTLVGSWLIALEGRSLKEQTNRELTIVAQNFAERIDIFVTDLLKHAEASAALPSMVNQTPEKQEELLQQLNSHLRQLKVKKKN